MLTISYTWKSVKDRETWRAAAHGVVELDTAEQLNNNESV